MAARTGTFGGSLNPFGGGSLGNLSAYSIGSNLAELEVYRTEVAWGNGTATDDEYVAALGKALAMTSENTRARETAQNRLDDAVYRIGRSKADAVGLDALIAFDQAALAKMSTGNLRYRDVYQSLDSEMAQRRSRDYGKLVDQYNAGEVSTQKLAAWVDAALGTIDSTDPDYGNWTGAKAELGRRLQTETDSQKYQDYQQGKIKAPEMIAYLTSRRDSFDPSSPDFAEWSRKVEDATVQAAKADLARKDEAFFNAYDDGHKTDKEYLSYLSQRIGAMKPDDPDLPSWQHRLTQAAFSTAEDSLRLDVQKGKQPVARLVTFYRNYQRTLKPGSAEWRTIERNLLSLHGASSGGGGSSSGTTPAGTPAQRVDVTTLGGVGSPKLIDPKYTLGNIMPLLSVNVGGMPIAIDAPTAAGRKAQRAAEADRKARVAVQLDALDLNKGRLGDARQAGDAVWLFQDPRKPGQMTAGQNPDGSPMTVGNRPVVDGGEPIMVLGSGYLPVTDEAYANLLNLDSDYHFQLGQQAYAMHDTAGYYSQLALMDDADKASRLVNSQAVQKSNQNLYDLAEKGIDQATRTGDWAAVVNIANAAGDALKGELANPQLDATRRARLQALWDKIAANPVLPQMDPVTGERIGGAIDIAASTFDKDGNATSVALNPGWHLSLDGTSKSGAADWGLVYDDVQDGRWEASHVIVHTTYGDRVVTGEVVPKEAPVNATVFANVADGQIRVDYPPARYISYTDENGDLVQAYSLDGSTWIRSMTGTVPSLQLNVDGLTRKTDDQGNSAWVYQQAGENDVVVFTENAADGSWKIKDQSFIDANPGMVDWYGIGNVKKYASTGGFVKETARASARGIGLGKTADAGDIYEAGGRRAVVGSPGEVMQVVTMSPSGELNLTSSATDYGPSKTTPWPEDRLARETASAAPANPWAKYQVPKATSLPPAKTGLGVSRPGIGRTQNIDLVERPSISSQLPSDTPSRFDGIGLKTVKPVNVDLYDFKAAPKTTAPPPVRKSTAINIDLLPAKKPATAYKPPAPPPVKLKPGTGPVRV